MTVDLPAPVLDRLRAEAARRGVRIDEVIAELADHLPADAKPDASPTAPRHTLAFVAAGVSDAGISPRLDDLLADGFGRD